MGSAEESGHDRRTLRVVADENPRPPAQARLLAADEEGKASHAEPTGVGEHGLTAILTKYPANWRARPV